MKKLFSAISLSLVFLAFSCSKEENDTVNVITDHVIASPDAVELTTLVGSTTTWSTDRRLFELEFSGANSAFKTTLVGYDYALTPGQYVLTPAAGAQIGNGILENTRVNGKDVTGGYVTVTIRDGKYTVSADVVLSGSNENALLYYQGALSFTPDPDPTVLTQVFSAQSNLGNGNLSVTLQLGTDGISSEFDMGTFTNVWKGDGGYLALDLYSEDGYLHEGTYTPSAQGGVINAGEFGIGWDPGDIYGMGWEFTDWGTCWWTVSGGTATAEKITTGIISVTKNENGWVISWGAQYPQEYVFTGPIPSLTMPEVSAEFEYAYTEGDLAECSDQDGNTYPEVMKHSITITNAAGETVAYLEPILPTGETELEGSYVSTQYAHQAGTLADGFEFSFGDWHMEGGSYYVKDGKKVFIEPGQMVEIIKLVTGAYEFKGEGFDFLAAGPDYVPGSWQGGGAGSFDGVELTKFLGKIDYTGLGMTMIGVELGTAGITVVPGDWGNTYGGDGNYLKLEIYSTDGSLKPGTYRACSEGGNISEGEFGIGYDGMFGASGTTWYTLVGGTPSLNYVTDGTLTVEADGDTYTVVLSSSVVKTRYIGKLNAE